MSDQVITKHGLYLLDVDPDGVPKWGADHSAALIIRDDPQSVAEYVADFGASATTVGECAASTTQPSFTATGQEIGALVDEKNKAYGDSFAKSGEILRVLYPNGVQPDQYTDMLGIIRVLDKFFRIATAKDAFGESPWRDIAGYGLLGVGKS